jgi:hypothetical protein
LSHRAQESYLLDADVAITGQGSEGQPDEVRVVTNRSAIPLTTNDLAILDFYDVGISIHTAITNKILNTFNNRQCV